MEFEWDENKNQKNIIKHKIDFADAIHVFIDNNRIEKLDVRRNYNEDRWQTLGITEFGILVIIYTERNKGNTIRIMSARKANKKERRYYNKGSFGLGVGHGN